MSQARIEANRANARQSTGPKTEAGKHASSRNALTHGFLARVVPAEDAEFHTMLEGLRTTLKPEDSMQHLLVEQIAWAYLRLQRLLAAEYKAWQQAGRRAESDAAEPDLERAGMEIESVRLRMRYDSMLTRQIQRNMALLERLQRQTRRARANAQLQAQREERERRQQQDEDAPDRSLDYFRFHEDAVARVRAIGGRWAREKEELSDEERERLMQEDTDHGIGVSDHAEDETLEDLLERCRTERAEDEQDLENDLRERRFAREQTRTPAQQETEEKQEPDPPEPEIGFVSRKR